MWPTLQFYECKGKCCSIQLLRKCHTHIDYFFEALRKRDRKLKQQTGLFLKTSFPLTLFSGGSRRGQAAPWTASWTWAGSWSSKPSWATTSDASRSTTKTSLTTSSCWWCSVSSGGSCRVTTRWPSNTRTKVSREMVRYWYTNYFTDHLTMYVQCFLLVFSHILCGRGHLFDT